jgi:hypothetical protein
MAADAMDVQEDAPSPESRLFVRLHPTGYAPDMAPRDATMPASHEDLARAVDALIDECRSVVRCNKAR